MVENLVKENTIIVKNSPKARLERFLSENSIQIFTAKDFDFPKDEETQAKIRREVDEFLEMREEWRGEDRELEKERNKWQ